MPRDAVFSRILWDEAFIGRLNKVVEAYEANTPGYRHIDVALSAAAIFCAGFNATNSPRMGVHAGMLALDSPSMKPLFGPEFEGRWDYDQHTPEGVAAIVKKAALFLGASLVGIAPIDERWIYSASFDMLAGGSAPITFTKVEEVVLPKGQVSSQQAGELIKAKLDNMSGEQVKAMMIEVLESIDPADLPPNAPPVGLLKMVPARQVKKRPFKISSMPTPMLRIFAKKLNLDFEIAIVDPGDSAKPHYLEGGALAIPETMKTVIVLAFEMDYDSIEASPTLMGDIGAGDGYSKMAVTAGSLAQFLRELGYNAIPCGNNTGLSVPQAVDAGLGEVGRHGILITPKYGPRVRLAKVITDLSMAYDKPISFGVREFCEVCKKCARECPGKAISHKTRTTEPTTISTNPGVIKWPVDAEKCFFGWQAMGSGCGVCIRVCPFNKPGNWLHEVTRIMIGAKSGSLDKALLKLDDVSGYGATEPKTHFWESDNYIHIKN